MLRSSQLLKKSWVRQVVLDEWFPLVFAAATLEGAPARVLYRLAGALVHVDLMTTDLIAEGVTASLPTKILEFRGIHASRISMSRLEFSRP